jgi:hypothetical protein
MRCRLALIGLVAACAAESDPPPVYDDPFEAAWSSSIRPGDAIVVVPGTGAVSGTGALIVESGGVLIARDHLVFVDPLEGAVAAAQRAGLSDDEIEGGAIAFGLWGTGVDSLDHVDYVSAGGLHVRFELIGGATVCGVGQVIDNVLDYNVANAELDARDLYRRTQAWLAGGPDRNVSFVSHSWGGVVAQYVATNLATLVHDHGPLGADTAMVVAAGVPGIVPGFTPHGPGFRTVESKADGIDAAIKSYEIDRPDDPVHSFNPSDRAGGHHYIIMIGEEHRGFYGITTDELSCVDVAGPCS